MDQSNAPRRTFRLHLALALVLGLSLVGLTQCRTVSDSITGIELNSATRLSHRSSCAHDCNRRYKHAKSDENERHKRALRHCHSSHRCRKNENERHRDALRDIKQDKKNCKKNCYNEGSGKGD